ncbi:MAG: hypothetical protein JO244_08095, partial [Solirubrobacterales bacterium]|nr:hypothetical protein [Solirubrobacterales bacterium]
CLSSTRSSEPPGGHSAAGVSFAEAEEAPEEWFAHRRGTHDRVQWSGFPGHWQMAVWNEDYRRRWVGNVTDAVAGQLWDGVFADNDVYDDYYALEPLAEVRDMEEIRHGLDILVREAGEQLNQAGKLLVPNIAESRREPGRWARHARYGGGFEEHWLGWQPEAHFDEPTCEQQAAELHGPGIGIVRANAGGPSAERGFRYAVAAFWVLGAGRGWACTATEPDDYEGLPYCAEQSWDLGSPIGPVLARDGGRAQQFTAGWAAVNLGNSASTAFEVPPGLVDGDGREAPDTVTLGPKEGRIYASAAVVERGDQQSRKGPLLALSIRSTAGAPGWLEMTGDARVVARLLRLPIRATYADGVVSRSPFIASGWSARVRLDAPAREPSSEILLELRADDDELVAIGQSGSALLLRLRIPGQRSDQTQTFDQTRHRWWAISVDPQGIRWSTSRDGVSWNTERELMDTEFPARRVTLALVAGHFEQSGAEEEAGIGVLEVVESAPMSPDIRWR